MFTVWDGVRARSPCVRETYITGSSLRSPCVCVCVNAFTALWADREMVLHVLCVRVRRYDNGDTGMVHTTPHGCVAGEEDTHVLCVRV